MTAPVKRTSLEAIALQPLREVAEAYSFPIFSGQGTQNRIPAVRTGYQFGDLRIDTDSHHLVVEVESAGGVTNLTKYWALIENGIISKPVILFHAFALGTANDYRSHLDLWDFLAEKMRAALGNTFEARRFAYLNSDEYAAMVKEFRLRLDELSRPSEANTEESIGG